jgi:hypothetical protein
MKILTFLTLWAIVEIIEKLLKNFLTPSVHGHIRADIIDEPEFFQ